MKKFITFISVFMLSLYSMASLVDVYQIYVTAPNGKVGQDAELTLNIKNRDSFASWACRVTLPEGIVIKSCSLVNDRYSGPNPSFSWQKVGDEDNTWLISAFDSYELYTSGDGAVAKITVSVPNDFEPGSYSVKLKKCNIYSFDRSTSYYPIDSSFDWTIEGNGSGGSGTGNSIYMTGANGKVGQDAELVLNLKNSDVVAILSTWIILPDNVIFNGITLTDRCNDTGGSYYSLSSDSIGFGINASPTCNTLTGNDGAVAIISVSIPDDFEPGNYNVELIRNAIKSPDGEMLPVNENSTFVWTIEGNGSGGGSGTGNEIYVTAPNGKAGQDAELTLNIKNVDEFSGWGGWVTLPEGIVFKGASVVNDRCSNYAHFDCQDVASIDNTWSIMCFDYNFSGNDGAVAKISVSIPDNYKSGNYNVKLSHFSLSTPEGVSIPCDRTSTFAWKIEGDGPEPEPEPEQDTDISRLDNIIYLNKTEGFVGQEKTLSFQMKNTAAIRGFQFDMYLPEGVTVAKNSKGRILGSLCTGRLPEDDEHTLTIQEQADGAIRFLCASQYDETFTGNSGEILTLTVNIAEDMADGDYPIVLKDMRLSETDINQYYDTERIKSTLTVSSYTIGDINADGSVNVSDYIGIANHILGDTPVGFVAKAADVNEDNVINVSDYIGVANIILTGSPYGTSSNVKPASSRAKASDLSAEDNVIYVEPLNVDAGTQATLSFQMKNTAAIRGFQFDLYLPDGVTAVKNAKGRIQGTLSSGRLPEDDEHTLTMQEQADGAIRFLCGSQYDETFTGTEGEIATLRVNIDANVADGVYPIILKNMRLSETDISKFYDSDNVETTLTVADPTPKVCAKPTIDYDNGKLIFNCETEGAVCQSTITDDDIKSYTGNEVELCVTYNISVYATKDGYDDSEVTTATLCWINAQPQLENITEVTEVEALPVLIQTQGNIITVQGAVEGTEIAVYSVGGTKEASAIAAGSIVTLNTSLRPGSVAIVKIGEKAVKVMMK